MSYRTHNLLARLLSLLAPLFITVGAFAQSINFTPIVLSGYSEGLLTSLQFGPDGRLYVSNQEGIIDILTVQRDGPGSYSVVSSERLELIRGIPNHNDDGSLHPVQVRQVTGILVLGTPSNPEIYVTSSDYRIGGAEGATDTNLDTNSGMLSKITKVGPGTWDKVDLVRGLPRSEENHSPNGMVYDAPNHRILLAMGGNTNAGAPSNNFAFLTEYAYAAAILSIDLEALESMPVQGAGPNKYVYDLPTLDDPTRANDGFGNDIGDPFGGNDGLNQAKIVPGSPVQIFAPGFRNPYDILITENGLIYTVDNGSNNGWGGTPTLAVPGDFGSATNNYDPAEPGSTTPDADGDTVSNRDTLQLIHEGYYGGHPNPVRANPSGAGLYTFGSSGIWRTSTDPSSPFPLPSDWPPVSEGNPIEGDYIPAMQQEGAIASWNSSTNGLAEYTATNFNGAMKGQLLVVNFDHRLIRVNLNDADNAAEGVHILASNFGVIPLDVIAQGDDDPFPGTIWVACYLGANAIVIFEPADYDGGSGVPCSGANDPNLDEDGDGYSNADEIAAGTDPCNTSDRPADADGDFLSDIIDPDDDNDGIPDEEDPFPLDPDNGANEFLPLTFELLNGNPGYGFGGVGFSGWMIDYQTNYLDLYDNDQLIVGGTSGVFTINDIDHGDAYLNLNTQRNAFQFGLNVDAQTGPFYILTRLLATNLFKPTPQDYQAAGFYIGNGDQDNYLRISAVANGGAGGIEVYYESQGQQEYQKTYPEPFVLSAAESIDLYLTIDPLTGIVTPSYAIDGASGVSLDSITVTSPILELLHLSPNSAWSNALAVGIIATSNPREAGTPLEETKFTADWDFIAARHLDGDLGSHGWETLSTLGNCEARSENSLAAAGDALILIGGRGTPPTEKLSLNTLEWTAGSPPPIQLHHFQAVTYEGLVYVVGAFTGNYPTEKGTAHIYIYDPVEDVWMQGREIPQERRRGAASAALLNGKIYIAGGNVNGHGQGTATTVAWLDVYDPLTNTWTPLTNAPHARDHAALVEAGGKLFFVGGRIGGDPGVFTATVAEVDVFDPATGEWETLPSDRNLPTPRAGVSAARLGSRVVVAGGESTQPAAHNEVEAYITTTGQWETLPPLQQGRHGTGMVAIGDTLLIAVGAGNQGGGPLLNSTEIFSGSIDPVLPLPPIIPGLLELTANSLDFGTTESGESTALQVAVSNLGGNQGILIHDLELNGDPVFQTSQPYELPFVLASNRSLEIDVIYNAQGNQSHSGTLVIHYGAGHSLTLELAGQSDSSGTIDPGWLTLNPASINFGTSPVGAEGGSGVVSVTNTGDQSLEIDAILLSGAQETAFAVEHGELPVALGPGDSYAFVVKATAVQPGANVANIVIEHTGTNTPATLGLTVTGTDLAAIRINSGGSQYMDSNGIMWAADSHYVGGDVYYNNTLTINGTPDQILYRRERYGAEGFGYAIPVANGTYTLELHFAEIWWGVSRRQTEDNTGQRVFSVLAEGQPILMDLDIWAEAGSATALIKRIENVTVSDGVLNLMVEVAVDNAKFTAIAVIPQSAQSEKSLALSPEVLDFGPVATGSNSSLSVTASNLSDQDIAVLSATISGPGAANYSTTLSTPIYLGPGDALPLSIKFAPTGAGSSAAVLTLTHDGPGEPVQVVMNGFGLPTGTLQASESTLNFGNKSVGSTSSKLIELTNSSGTSVHITDVGITGPGAAAFSTDFTPTSIPATSKTLLEVQYAPPTTGVHTASLVIDHNGVNSPLIVTLEGAGVFSGDEGTIIRINAGGKEYTDTFGNVWSADAHYSGDAGIVIMPCLEIEGTSDDPLYQSGRLGGNGLNYEIPVEPGIYDITLHFAEIWWGAYEGEGLDNSGKRNFTVFVEGTAVLTDYDIFELAGPAMAIPETFLNVQVVDGNLSIEFAPSAGDAWISGIELSSVEAPTDPEEGELIASPMSVSLGQVQLGDSGNDTVTLSNSGSGPLQITGVQISGAGAAAFSTNLTTGLLNPGDDLPVTVTFTPLVEGAAVASLAITHDAPDSPLIISLSGEGVEPSDPSTFVIRINAGGGAYTDSLGLVWQADQYHTRSGGTWADDDLEIADTNEDPLYQTERWGKSGFGYQIPVPNGQYKVRLHFAEIWWSVSDYIGQDTTGRRIFSIDIEGVRRITDFDIFAEAGAAAALVKEFSPITVTDGILHISTAVRIDHAKISAIEVIGL